MISDMISDEVHPRCLLFTNVTIPATCGAAIEVPLLKLKMWVANGSGFGPTSKFEAAKMLIPGARTSGLMIPPFMQLGPREEKDATAGEGVNLNWVPLKCMLASALGWFLK
ncbi:hypothetical protein MA16_Dca000434 [Dendrobium catenatum]|uniref:Uncharacterized protein n=1 Tax=Dendrobium catenatum TaxID=906689 RepID=A0A2I0WTV5_9ASPA|nr:hypothetical protein MA16_Dca000434 [Dendrobium catenatum]